MNAIADAARALAGIPAFDFEGAEIEPLPVGSNNRSFLVRTVQGWFVLRLSDPKNVPVGVDRQRELRTQEAAGNAGIAAAIMYANIDAGIFLTEYVAGAPLRMGDMQRPSIIKRIASLLRAVHELPVIGPPLDLEAAAGSYVEQVAVAARKNTAARCARIIAEDASTREETTCCHNDIICANIIAGDRLRLIDWEYAGANDPYFDLAVLTGYHDLPAPVVESLLHAYAGSASAENRARLEQQRRIFDAVQFLWIAAGQSRKPAPDATARLDALEERLR